MVLIESLLNASGSSKPGPLDLGGFGVRNVFVRVVPPLRARSKFEGMFCSDSKRSSSRLGLDVEVWGSRLYCCDMITEIHCRDKQFVCIHE